MKNYNYRDDKNYNYDNYYAIMRNYNCDFAILDSQKFNSYNDPYSNILFTDIKKVNESNQVNKLNKVNESNQVNQVNDSNQVNRVNDSNKVNQVNDLNKVNQVNEVNYSNKVNDSNKVNEVNDSNQYEIKELIKRLILLDDNLIKLEKCKDCIIKNIFHVELLFDEAIIREKNNIYRKSMIDKLSKFKKIGNDIITSIKNNEDKFLNYSNELRNLIKDIFNLL